VQHPRLFSPSWTNSQTCYKPESHAQGVTVTDTSHESDCCFNNDSELELCRVRVEVGVGVGVKVWVWFAVSRGHVAMATVAAF